MNEGDQTSLERFRGIFEQSLLSMQVFSPDGRLRLVNSAWEKLWGVTPEQISEYNILEDRQLIAKGVMPYIKMGFDGESCIIPSFLYDLTEPVRNSPHYSGAQRWLKGFIYPIKDKEAVKEVVLILEEITEQKRKEAFKQGQEFFEAVLDNIEDGIVACDSEGVLTIFNRALRKIHDLPEKPLSAENWASYYDLYLPDGKTLMKPEDVPLFKAFHGETVHDLEMIVAPNDKPARHLLANGRSFHDEQGNKRGAVVIMHDVTERKQAEDELQRSYSILQAVIEGTPDAIFVKDLSGRYLLANSALLRFLGKSSEQVVGVTDNELYPSETAREFTEQDRIVISTGRTQSFEGVAVGQRVKQTYLVTKTPYRDSDGSVIGLIGISHDITERKKAEEQQIVLIREQEARKKAEEANHLKDEFLATLSHELRTPLTPILGWIQMLRLGSLDKENSERAFEAIERNVNIQVKLVGDILDVSRIITGKLELNKQPISLAPIIESAINSIRPEALEKHVKLNFINDGKAGLVLGDTRRLQQVIWNLLTNALKFTSEGGRIELSLKHFDSKVSIQVKDNGVGISPEFLPYVFERFRQADQTSTRNHGGLGLGLAISRHFVELHQGKTSAESEGIGRGSTFAVEFPLTENKVEETGASGKSNKEINAFDETAILKNRRILLVDDDVDSLSYLSYVLKSCGAEVETAVSADRALRSLQERSFDLLISDIGIPGKDGYKLIGEVRNLKKSDNDSIPAIALTAYARDEDQAKSINAGFQMHISKPVEPAQLVESVVQLLNSEETAVKN